MEEEQLTKRERRELAKEEKRKEREKSETASKVKKIITFAIIATIAGWLIYSGYKYVTTPTGQNVQTIEASENDQIRGNKEAKVTLVEFGDYQCPACADYEPFVDRLNKEFPDDLKIVHKHYPLLNIHKNALSAAKAAEAAAKQNKFWEMHKLLYEKQSEWANEGDPKGKFSEYASGLGLDKDKFVSDLDSDEIKNKIDADIALGNNLRLTSTPSFFINGEKVAPRSYEEFKAKIEDFIRGYSIE